MNTQFTRRNVIKTAAVSTAALFVSGCEKAIIQKADASNKSPSQVNHGNEEYVWISANANLPLFTAHDHPALKLAAEQLGVQVTIAGPNSIDIPSLVGVVEQTIARKPSGMMVVGWDPSALVPAINRAVEAGIPTICVDADVPGSRRAAFVGTDWHDIGVQQAQAMINALKGRKGKIGMLGLIEQTIMQQAFAGFRSIAVAAGYDCMEPQQDKGNQAEATRVASAIIQAVPDLVGLAGFDSESGPGIGQAIKELDRIGKIIATTVQAEGQVVQFIADGIMTAAIIQKRELFTYQGLKALFEMNHSPIKFTSDDRKAGISAIPVHYSTGTFAITRENAAMFIRPA